MLGKKYNSRSVCHKTIGIRTSQIRDLLVHYSRSQRRTNGWRRFNDVFSKFECWYDTKDQRK